MQGDLESALGRFVLDGFPAPVVVLDRDGSVVASNRAAQEGPVDLVHVIEDRFEVDVSDFLSDLRAGMHASAEVTCRGRVIRLEGRAAERWFVVVGRDAADAHDLAEELKQLRSGASLALVAASLVHDFNNLLTPVLILSSRLTDVESKKGDSAMIAAEIHSAATLAASLMRDVLSLARPRAAPLKERVDINDVVVERRRLIERLVGDDVEVALDLSWDIGEVLVDRKRLEHAILNLVANARDAMRRGGRLTISTRAADEGDERRVALSVADTGVGMTDDVRRRAFESFFTTKADSGGFGIGLATVQRFASDSGGHVTLESEPLSGTTAALILPRVVSSAPRALPAESVSKDGAGERVLVADRDERVRHAIQIALEARGYSVVFAATADGAVEAAEAHAIKVALVDTHLPCRDPRTFLHRLRAGSPEVRIVFLADAPQDDRTIELRATVLPKAFSEEELVRAVREAVAS